MMVWKSHEWNARCRGHGNKGGKSWSGRLLRTSALKQVAVALSQTHLSKVSTILGLAIDEALRTGMGETAAVEKP